MLNSCDQIEPLLSAYMDDELDAADRDAVKAHIVGCANCARELNELRGLAAATEEFTAPSVDDEIWDAFLHNVYNRLERRLGWTLLILGSIIVAGVLVYEAVVLPWTSTPLKIVFFTPIVGLVMLFVSVFRQRRHVARSDRYSRDVRH